MKQRLYLSVFFSLLSVFVLAQSQRMVLLEHFTQASCGPCATYNPQINNLLNNNPDKIIAIMYHTSWPGYDPMYEHNTVENAARTGFYSVSSVPNSVLDGNYFNGHPANWNISTVNNRYAVPSPCNMSVYHVLSNDHNTIKAYVLIDATQDIPEGTKLQLAIIEKHIGFATPPGTNGEKDFYNVMKKMLPNHTGTVLSEIQGGEYNIMEFAWEHENVYDVDELAAVSFLQNPTTKEVLQSALSNNVPFEAPYNTDADITRISNISQNYCNGYMAPKITIRNNGENELTSLDITYTINESEPVTMNWSGNLAFLESETIEMDGTDFTVMENNVLTATIENPNGQNDDYETNNTKTIDIEEAPQVTSPVTLVLKLDNHPEETSWKVVDDQANVLYEGGNYTQAGQIKVEQFVLADDGCYSFLIFDEGGDGLTEGGSYKLGYNGNIIFAEGASFGEKDEAQFSLDLTAVNELQSTSELRLYPVPVKDQLNFNFIQLQNSPVTYSIVEPSGRVVRKNDLGIVNTGSITRTIDLTDLEAGIYFITIENGDKQTIRKFVVTE